MSGSSLLDMSWPISLCERWLATSSKTQRRIRIFSGIQPTPPVHGIGNHRLLLFPGELRNLISSRMRLRSRRILSTQGSNHGSTGNDVARWLFYLMGLSLAYLILRSLSLSLSLSYLMWRALSFICWGT